MKSHDDHHKLVLTRQKARRIAIGVLFQSEFGGNSNHQGADWSTLFEEQIEPETEQEIRRLVEGVSGALNSIDADIKNSLQNWRLERVMLVDKTILRLATWEMKYAMDPLPAPIVIDEYVELAKIFGTEDSGGFVNGVLDRIAREIPWQKDELEKVDKTR